MSKNRKGIEHLGVPSSRCYRYFRSVFESLFLSQQMLVWHLSVGERALVVRQRVRDESHSRGTVRRASYFPSTDFAAMCLHTHRLPDIDNRLHYCPVRLL